MANQLISVIYFLYSSFNQFCYLVHLGNICSVLRKGSFMFPLPFDGLHIHLVVRNLRSQKKALFCVLLREKDGDGRAYISRFAQ